MKNAFRIGFILLWVFVLFLFWPESWSTAAKWIVGILLTPFWAGVGLHVGERLDQRYGSASGGAGSELPQYPLLTIWTKPRATIRRIVDSNPKKYVILLAILSGVEAILDGLEQRVGLDFVPLPGVFLYAAILGSIVGVLTLYLGGSLLRWTGSWLGGQATVVQVRAAMAWGSVPRISLLILWFPRVALSHTSEHAPGSDYSLPFTTVDWIVTLWGVFVFLKCIGEVHRFSAWKSLLLISPLIILAILRG